MYKVQKKKHMGKKHIRENIKLTSSNIIACCQVSKRTALQWIKDEKLKAFQLPGGHFRIDKEDFKFDVELDYPGVLHSKKQHRIN